MPSFAASAALIALGVALSGPAWASQQAAAGTASTSPTASAPILAPAPSPVAEAVAARLSEDGPVRLALAQPAGADQTQPIEPVTIDGEAAALRQLYAARDNEPLWVGTPTADARLAALIDALGDADAEGLSPNDYWMVELSALAGRTTPAALAQRELLASAAVMRYARDVQTGRIAPTGLPVEAEIDYDRRTIDKVAAVEAAAAAPDLARHLAGLAPGHRMYRDLRSALAWAREQAAAGGWPEMPPGETLRPGDRDERVPALRARLEASGDYLPGGVPEVAEMPESVTLASTGPATTDESTTDSADPTLYDAALVASVESFQRRHGLLIDGIVGPRTLAALNVTATERAEQAAAAMERWRWLPPDLGSRYIMVNIPEYRLEVVEGRRVVRDMEVIVGRASRPTPLFSSALTWLEWNPTWTVPTSIAEKDYLPHLIEDPTYLSNKNMYVYAGWQPNAPVVDTQAVDWEEVGRGIRSFMLRQEPGPGNALGKVKFMMSNNFSVYLHDTPERYLFARTHRAYSSGCVRVQDPMWLADYLLAADPTWTGHESEPVMNHWRTTRMNMPSGMPLHVAYVTARLGEDGRPMFFEDIYGLDAAMADALAAHRPERTQIALAD